MERELLKLLDDFRNGKLDAFGSDCGISLDKLDSIRMKQEELALSHFQQDVQDKEGLVCLCFKMIHLNTCVF